MNAKKELLYRAAKRNIRCALITYNPSYTEATQQTIVLKENYSKADLEGFLKELDFEYDNGWGHQYIDGTVWLNDGCWLERQEYDGSEGWDLKEYPEIPEQCKRE